MGAGRIARGSAIPERDTGPDFHGGQRDSSRRRSATRREDHRARANRPDETDVDESGCWAAGGCSGDLFIALRQLSTANVEFTVPAFPNQTFRGTVARIARSVEVKTRTMPVELDVRNADGRLASGMFPEVLWPVHRSAPTLFVPTSAVARTTEATFVVRIRNGNPEWVDVRTGEVDGKLVEMFGDLQEGNEVAVRGTDELRPGTRVNAQVVALDGPKLAK